ncbi:MAG TPA: hypothetical protein PK335_12020 [Draconibacterium sp.]|nr:hypothetical protein [Draconibacterium sp.]
MSIESIDEMSRLAMLNIENNPGLAEQGIEGYYLAFEQLKRQKLRIVVSSVVSESRALQSALLTAINSGKRAFKGGVFIKMPMDVTLLLPWSRTCTLNDAVVEVGGDLTDVSDASFTLYIGIKAVDTDSLEIVANGWQGGVVAAGDDISLTQDSDGVLGGIFAGSLGVALGFLRISGEKLDSTADSCGLSLWRPDLHWLDHEAIGSEIKYFPKKIWLLGLGHLGQAYVWAISLFSFSEPNQLTVMLQDTDIVKPANIDTGLLSDSDSCEKKIKKTRLCSKWLEDRHIDTNICERYFDESFNPTDVESDILISGLDSVETRRILNTDKFKNILDCGLGGNKSNFDSISFYNLGISDLKPEEIWKTTDNSNDNPESRKLYSNIFACGEYDKGIGASFIGGIASTLVLSEIMRAYNGGIAVPHVRMSVRNQKSSINVSSVINYGNPMKYSKAGFVELL